MKRLIVILLLAAAVIGWAASSSIGIRILRGEAKDLGEGGPAVRCLYAGAFGLASVSFLVDAGQHPNIAAQEACPWVCTISFHIPPQPARLSRIASCD